MQAAVKDALLAYAPTEQNNSDCSLEAELRELTIVSIVAKWKSVLLLVYSKIQAYKQLKVQQKVT